MSVLAPDGIDTVPGVVAVVLVTVTTLAIGAWGLRLSRTTSDFFVASRTVHPGLNASAIGGEYLSAASFLGVAGLVLTFGADMLWYPVGWTAGYLVLLVLVAAPLRRSGAYTLPDFAEARLGSRGVRAVCSVLVVAVGWLYLLPQFMGAGITLEAAIGAPAWVGPAIVALVVLLNVTSGGMRSITFVQAFQYWLKLTALLLPAAVLLVVWAGERGTAGIPGSLDWSSPAGGGGGGQELYLTYSLIVATFLGTMGLPHVVVRFYTNPDGRAARRTTLVVLVLLGLFYLLPPIYGLLGRIYAPELVGSDRADTLVLELPRLMLPGAGGELLTGLVTAGAFAAFLSTASGLSIAVAGVLSQDVTGRAYAGRRLGGIAAFRVGAVVAVLVPATAALVSPDLGVARAVGLAFAVAASTFCPLLVLGIWWRRLTDVGAIAGLAAGGLGSGAAVAWTMAATEGRQGWADVLMSQPAAWSVPLAFLTMVLASLLTPGRVPGHTGRFLVRLHTPEELAVERGLDGHLDRSSLDSDR
ncbi:cation acetate symporter [Nocardioides sp.]|uniref:sodium/solute symporter n=1 Tax=Nocardioides sp. TaxID=35761 RepID=UPI0035655574